MRRLRDPVPIVLGAGVAILLALTVYLGSGARADARCTNAFFVPGGEWSWTHLATRCEYGEPARYGYAHSWAFYLLLVAVAALVWWCVSRWLARRREAS